MTVKELISVWDYKDYSKSDFCIYYDYTGQRRNRKLYGRSFITPDYNEIPDEMLNYTVDLFHMLNKRTSGFTLIIYTGN